MPSIRARLSHASERLSEHGLWAYALVPLLLATLNGTKIQSVLTSSYDFHAGISFGVPLPVTDAWAFVSAPSGNGVNVAGPDLLGVGLFGFGVLLQGIVLAGYLGGLARQLRGEPARLGDTFQQYFLRFLGFTVVLLVLFLPPVLFVLAARSLALDGGAYLRYAVGYALVVLVISIPATLVVVNVPLLGVLLGVVGLAPVGLVLDTATLLFVADITDAPGLGTDDGSRPHRAALSPAARGADSA